MKGGSADVALRRSNRHVIVDVLERTGIGRRAYDQLTPILNPSPRRRAGR